MKGSDLLSHWEAPDNSRLTPKQVSLRLPVHVAARIAALCDMYPQKTKTDIIGDLLRFALDEVQSAFPEIKDNDTSFVARDEISSAVRYRILANEHYAELEKALGNDSPPPLFPVPDNSLYRSMKPRK